MNEKTTAPRTPAAEEAAASPPADDVDPARCSEPVDTGDGEVVICQDAQGSENVIGGGEFPDPDAPPQAPAPGSVQ
jgi:hypothetical protein